MATQRVSDTGVITTVHLSIIAVLAILTVLAILWGARLKRQRERADEVEAERIEAQGGEVPDADQAARPLEEPSARTSTATADRRAAASPHETAPDTEAKPDRAETAAAPAPSPSPPPPPAEASAAPKEPARDEPIAAAGPMDASPASEAEPAAAPAPTAESAPIATASAASLADEPVTRLKGLGPKVAARLAEHGITTIGQLAVLDATAAERLDARLGPFTGRMVRDRWIEQARFLAAGDRAGFEAVFGKL